MGRRLGGPQSMSERYGIEKNLFPLPGIEPRPSNQVNINIFLLVTKRKPFTKDIIERQMA
jgi:hypothetical protein